MELKVEVWVVVELPKVVEHLKGPLVDKKTQLLHQVVNPNHHPKVVVEVVAENKRVSKKKLVEGH